MFQKLFGSHCFRFLVIASLTGGVFLHCLDGGRLAMLWGILTVAAGALACCVCIPRTWVTYASMTVLSLALTCAGIEYYYYLTSYNDNRVCDGKYPIVPDAELGYAPKAQASATRSTVTVDGKPVYSVTYTTGADGWRATPQHPKASKAVVFLGCSYTMGEGVEDADSYPWKVAEALGDDWQVYNFGLSGYGAHHALALLESGRLDPLFALYDTVKVFFLTLPGHELRVSGFSAWDKHGPRYLVEDGKAVRRGHFDEPLHPGWIGAQWQKVRESFMQTQLCKEVIMQILRFDHTGMIRRQGAIFLGLRDYVREHYPNADFTLLVYPSAAEDVPIYEEQGVPLINLAEAFPDWPDDAKYRISLDRHPTPVAYAKVAALLAARISRRDGAR